MASRFSAGRVLATLGLLTFAFGIVAMVVLYNVGRFRHHRLQVRLDAACRGMAELFCEGRPDPEPGCRENRFRDCTAPYDFLDEEFVESHEKQLVHMTARVAKRRREGREAAAGRESEDRSRDGMSSDPPDPMRGDGR